MAGDVSNAQSDRIGSLLAQTDEAIRSNNLPKASEALREASHLDSNNAQVKEKWLALQKQEAGADVVDLIRLYIGSSRSGDGEKALQSLRQKQLAPSDASQAIELLLHARPGPKLLDPLIGAVLSRNFEARKMLATRLSANATEAFDLIFKHGEESSNAFVPIVLEAALWSSEEQQAEAQRDFFRLCVARLMEAGEDHLEKEMKCIARLLSSAADTVSPIVDPDVFDAILSFLDIRFEAPLRAQATLATSKLLQATKERGEELFSGFITERAAKHSNDDLIVAFSAAAAVFPVIPAVAANLFLIDGFVQQLVPNLEKNWEDGAAGKRKSHTLEIAALELLSAACVDKSCREAINRYCSHWLENLSEEREGTHKALSSLVLAKISAESSEHVTAKLEQLVLHGDQERDQAIEGLAYTSLQPGIKEEIAGNEKLMTELAIALKDRQSAVFGCLNIFYNLTVYRTVLSEEQKKMSQLKAYANASKPAPEDPLDDDAHVTGRCKRALDVNVIPSLVACCKQMTSPTNVALVVRILLALAKEQKHRAKMAQQGAVRLLLQIRNQVAKTDKSTGEASAIERDASHALARLLISINPSHVFSAALPASSAVSALVPLLSQDQDIEGRNLLPTFEALLALTNLASMEDNSIRDLQLRLAWSQLEDHLLFSSNVLVQRASVELLCNLMLSPSCVAKFVGDASKREATRMQILLALADVEDLATRRAAGGALAMLTEWDAAVAAILDQETSGGRSGVKVLLSMCADESDEIKHRGFACLANVINTPGDLGKRGVQEIKAEGDVEQLRDALKTTKNRDLVSIGVEVLKRVT